MFLLATGTAQLVEVRVPTCSQYCASGGSIASATPLCVIRRDVVPEVRCGMLRWRLLLLHLLLLRFRHLLGSVHDGSSSVLGRLSAGLSSG